MLQPAFLGTLVLKKCSVHLESKTMIFPPTYNHNKIGVEIFKIMLVCTYLEIFDVYFDPFSVQNNLTEPGCETTNEFPIHNGVIFCGSQVPSSGSSKSFNTIYSLISALTAVNLFPLANAVGLTVISCIRLAHFTLPGLPSVYLEYKGIIYGLCGQKHNGWSREYTSSLH